MTKRELRAYFAGKALQGMLANPILFKVKKENGVTFADFNVNNAKAAWSIADMMLQQSTLCPPPSISPMPPNSTK